MADAAIARREARRKKILENSQNRLNIISGKKDEDVCNESAVKASNLEDNNEISGLPENSTFLNSIGYNGELTREFVTNICSNNLFMDQENEGSGDSEVTTDVSGLNYPIPQADTALASKSLQEKVYLYKYDVVLISVLIQILFSLSIVSFENNYFFLPIIMYTVTRLLFVHQLDKSTSLANLFLIMNGVSGNNIQLIMNYMQWISNIFQDMCIYVFVVIIIQSLLIYCNKLIT